MKQNTLQIISICLCIALLAVCIYQGVQLKETREQLTWDLQELQNSLRNEMNSLSSRMESAIEETQRLVFDCSIEPVGINPEEWTALTYVSVSLKEWYDSTKVTLVAVGDEGSLSQNITHEAGGKFSGNITFPLDNLDFHEFYVEIRNEDKLTTESLPLWVDYISLLPLYSYGGGWDGPDYENGIVSSWCYINLESQDRTGEKPQVFDPEFQVYKNGQLVQTYEATVSVSHSVDGILAYTVNAPDNKWRLECEEGDSFEIRFLCRDTYGLGYDFRFMTGMLEDGFVQEANWLDTPDFRLFRPEE